MCSSPNILLAPLQGLTDFHFRNAYQKCFDGVDQFYTPWIKLDGAGNLKKSQLRDIDPINNPNIRLIPQIMCKNADDFLVLANYLNNLGYEEINWNLGCPHPMITKRGLGSALLKDQERILSILDEVITKVKIKISLKMRLGFENEDSAAKLFPKLNDYPIRIIIVHARTAMQMYKGRANIDAFESCIGQSKHKLVYNGDLDSFKIFQELKTRFPQINDWMIGRGLIANPFLARMIKSNSAQLPENYREIFNAFHQELLESYASHLSGEKHLLLKMLGFWQYFSTSFYEPHKALKRIKKAKTLAAYYEAVRINLKMDWVKEKTLDTHNS